MSSLFEKAREWLPSQMQVAATSGNTIIVTRNAEELDLTGIAWVGRTVFASNLDGGAAIEFGDRDYLVPVESYVFAGEVTEPDVGDRFTETIDGMDITFQVQKPDTGEPAVRLSDQGRKLWRIHCKEIG